MTLKNNLAAFKLNIITNAMRRIISVTIQVVILCVFISATSPLETIANPFTKTVGKSIDSPRGEQWIVNYMKTNDDVETIFLLQADDLRGILNKPGCIGISLFYALDSKNEVFIIPIGIDFNGRMIKSDTIAVSNGYSDWRSAKNLISRYSGTLVSHFFGANSFSRLFQVKKCRAVRAVLALDDYGRQELLLYDADVLNPTTFEGKSLPCPSICPNN